ncbi:unnamed protein product [Camellia sinensis]
MVIFLILLLVLKLSVGQDDCTPTTCSNHGPTIRFPFRLNNCQPQHCGYPGFELSCSQTNDTSIHITDPYGYFPRQLRNLNLSSSPFQFSDFVYNFSLFSCPAKGQQFHDNTCLGGESGSEVIAVYSNLFIDFEPLLSCRNMYNISFVPFEIFDRTPDLQLKWPKQIYGNCEAQGKYCRLNISNNTGHENFECFGFLKPPMEGELKKLQVITGVVVGSFLLVIVVIALCCVHRSKKIKREDQSKIERFLEDYRALKPSRYSYADIKKITNQFTNKVGQGGYGTAYRGQLSNYVHVVVKILDSSKGKGGRFRQRSGNNSIVSMATTRGTIGYIAPEALSKNFGNDFDVTVQNTNQVYFPEWIYNRLHRGEELGIQLRDDADAKIAKKLAIAGLWCIQWCPVDRPSMNVVVKMLKGDGDTLIMPTNPFSSTNPTATSGVVDVRHVNSELEIIVESE